MLPVPKQGCSLKIDDWCVVSQTPWWRKPAIFGIWQSERGGRVEDIPSSPYIRALSSSVSGSMIQSLSPYLHTDNQGHPGNVQTCWIFIWTISSSLLSKWNGRLGSERYQSRETFVNKRTFDITTGQNNLLLMRQITVLFVLSSQIIIATACLYPINLKK